MKERIQWIDAMKGFGILMVVFSHVQLDIGHQYLNSFKMPLFFFCSGLVVDYSKINGFFSFIKKKFSRLMYPYFLWSLLLYTFWVVFDRGEGDIYKNFIGIFYASGGKEYMDWGVIMWFLPSLFLVELLHATLIRSNYSNFLIGIIGVIGFIYSNFINFKMPWSINISFVMLLFYHMGYIWKNRFYKVFNYWYLPLCVIVWLYSVVLNGDVVVYQGEFNNPLLFLLGGISGIISIRLLVQMIPKIESLLAYIGRRVFLVFLLHIRTITLIKAVQIYILHVALDVNIFSSIIYTLISSFITVLLFDFVDTNMPWLLKINYENKTK